jgi:hypothetical protein
MSEVRALLTDDCIEQHGGCLRCYEMFGGAAGTNKPENARRGRRSAISRSRLALLITENQAGSRRYPTRLEAVDLTKRNNSVVRYDQESH